MYPIPPKSSPHHHLRSHTAFHDHDHFHAHDQMVAWKKHFVTCSFDHTTCFVVFQSNAATRGSLPAAAGRCSVSQCLGIATAGQHVRTRVTRWTVPVSIAHPGPFTPPFCYIKSITHLISRKNGDTQDLSITSRWVSMQTHQGNTNQAIF